MQYPKITIVTPVLNQVNLIKYTIESILSQNYPNLEYIIIDGGSTDGTVDIIQKYESKLAFWVSEPDNGMYDAIQKGFKYSTGEIMAWLNADDMYHKGSLFTIAEIFSTFPEVEWLEGINAFWDNHYSGGRVVAIEPSRIFSKYEFLMGDYHWIQQESTVWRRTLWNKTKGLNTNLKYAGDFALWLVFFRYAKLYRTNALIGGFRQWSNNQLSHNDMNKYEKECNDVLKNETISQEDAQIISKYKKICKLNRVISKSRFLFKINLEQRFRNKHFGYTPIIYYSFEQKRFVK